MKQKPSRHWARRSFPAPARRGSPISSISNCRCRQATRRSKRASSMFAHPMPISTALRSAQSILQARRSTMAAASRSSVRASSTILSTQCGRTRSRAGKVPADHWSTSYCAAMRSMSSTEPSKAMKPSAFRTCRISRRRRGGDHGDQREGGCRDCRRRRVGLGLCRRTGKTRQESRGAGARAGLAAVRTDEFRHLGKEDKASGRPVHPRGKAPGQLRLSSGLGAWRSGTALLRQFPAPAAERFQDQQRDWPISYHDVAPYYDKVASDIGVSGDAKAEEIWRPAGEPYPMPPMKTFRNGQVWLKGFEAVGIRMVPAAVGMNSTEYRGRPACIYDGWCHVGCPIGALANPLVTYLADARTAGAEVRPWSTVTRVLTNSEGTRVTGVEYYDQKKERQLQEANVVVLAAWAAQNPRILLNAVTDKHAKGLANSNGLVGK